MSHSRCPHHFAVEATSSREREDFLLEELERVNSDLLCKLDGSPRAVTLLIPSRARLLTSFGRSTPAYC